jgi:hypothetical protein
MVLYVGSSADLAESEKEMIRESDEMGVIGGAVRMEERSDAAEVLPVNVWSGVRTG